MLLPIATLVDRSSNAYWYATYLFLLKLVIITGPPTHSVGGQTSNGRGRLSSSVVVVCNAGQALTLCRFQANDSSTATGRPVVLRPVWAIPC